jgi:hypothetical protein
VAGTEYHKTRSGQLQRRVEVAPGSRSVHSGGPAAELQQMPGSGMLGVPWVAAGEDSLGQLGLCQAPEPAGRERSSFTAAWLEALPAAPAAEHLLQLPARRPVESDLNDTRPVSAEATPMRVLDPAQVPSAAPPPPPQPSASAPPHRQRPGRRSLCSRNPFAAFWHWLRLF